METDLLLKVLNNISRIYLLSFLAVDSAFREVKL